MVEQRVRREHQSSDDPEVLAVREQHQPHEWEKEYSDKYKEAAPSVAWGRAMMERGLDFPIDHLERVAKQFEVVRHPLEPMASRLRVMRRMDGATLLREWMDSADPRDKVGFYNPRAAEAKLMAAILGHADAILPHPTIKDYRPRRRGDVARADAKTLRLARRADGQVGLLPEVRVRLAPEGRALCNAYPLTFVEGPRAVLSLDKQETTETVSTSSGTPSRRWIAGAGSARARSWTRAPPGPTRDS